MLRLTPFGNIYHKEIFMYQGEQFRKDIHLIDGSNAVAIIGGRRVVFDVTEIVGREIDEKNATCVNDLEQGECYWYMGCKFMKIKSFVSRYGSANSVIIKSAKDDQFQAGLLVYMDVDHVVTKAGLNDNDGLSEQLEVSLEATKDILQIAEDTVALNRKVLDQLHVYESIFGTGWSLFGKIVTAIEQGAITEEEGQAFLMTNREEKE